ncbi:MAG: prolipoprotein diacylglyceryl transferase [Armatimonadetes bacterium]|nr:prolipoprotein diacylglyceryl transferase [Armatimonadota bacterium]
MMLGLFLTALGYGVAGVVLVHEARRRRLATNGMAVVALWGFVGGLLIARLAHWLLVERQFLLSHPASFLDPRLGGRTILAGVAGGWLCVALTKRRLGIRRSTGDLWALALPAGEAVGRLGCFVNGCCHGAVTTVPWAVWQHEAWRHPTQLYSAAWAAITYALLRAWRDRVPCEGDLFRAYLVLFGLGRCVIESVRAQDQPAAWLSLGQQAALALVAAAVVWQWLSRRCVTPSPGC